jgi:hypothetical protein
MLSLVVYTEPGITYCNCCINTEHFSLDREFGMSQKLPQSLQFLIKDYPLLTKPFVQLDVLKRVGYLISTKCLQYLSQKSQFNILHND